ncbi:MAG TPA: hypothetical protein DCE33_03880 [Rhodospirillaceae bacterium]|nr:hypothetical protein [Rhodospirillaceae bacterium]
MFDKFSLADYVTSNVEKALLLNFQFTNAVIMAVPKGSDVSETSANKFPALFLQALGDKRAKLLEGGFKNGVNFAGVVGVKDGSIQQSLLNSMGVKKTSHVVRGRFTDEFLDITGLVLPEINLSLKALLAKLNLDFSIPNLKPTFFMPFGFANTRFDISRERDVLGQTTGVITAALVSDVEVKMPGLGTTTYPAVRISGSLDTGIKFGSLLGVDFPRLFDLPWASLTDVKLVADVIRKVPLGPPVLKVTLTAKGRVNDVRNIPVEASVEIEGKQFGSPYFRFPKYNFDLGKIPGLKEIPGVSGVKLEDPVISPTAVGGKLTIDKLKIKRADVLFFQTKKPTGWNFATKRTNLSPATFFNKLNGSVIDKAKLKEAALIVSKPGFNGKVSDLPKAVRKWLKAPLPDDEMALPLASGVNMVGVLHPHDVGGVGKALKSFGVPKEVVVLGGVSGVLDSKPASLRMSGGFPKLTMPKLGFLKLPTPKNAPALFMEYLNGQPALGVEVTETLPLKDGKKTVDLESKLALTVSVTGAASISMSGTTSNDWQDPYGIKGLTLRPGTTMSVSGGVTGPQVSFNGITEIGSKEVTLGGALNSVGASFWGTIDSLGLSDVAELATEISSAGGKKLSTKGLPEAEFKKVSIGFAAPGVSIPDLGISGGGTRVKGDFYFLDPRKRLGSLDVILDVTGMAAKSNIGEIVLGPLALKKNVLDFAAKTSASPHFSIKTSSKILGVDTALEMEAKATGIKFTSTQKFGDLFAYSFGANTGVFDWGMADFSKADLRLAASLKSDPGKWIRTQGKAAVKKAFDTLKPGLDKAVKDLEAAQKKVDGLNKDIAKQRAIVKKEKEPSVNRLKKAEAEVAKLQKSIDGFEKQIKKINGRIKTCHQNKRICVWGKYKTKCKKKNGAFATNGKPGGAARSTRR